MPYPQKHKEQVRKNILRSASKAFRRHGIKEVSVPSIMKGAGLTHGGFYAHFTNKEQLVAEACSGTIEETIAFLSRLADEAPNEQRLKAVIEFYLSEVHRDTPEDGCLLPTLSSEISRSTPEIKAAFTEQLRHFLSFMSSLVGGDQEKGIALTASLVGAMLLSRAVSDTKFSESILKAVLQQTKTAAAASN
ncbi:TetR/AcrR family transcriptional regulator [Paenibacillus alginolyticus]|uniref:TetR/AcrR family transcriptional regulator n=1 Tax=Paenibacillus alginolyticus TaxID=59839 RepID=UPI00042078DA|nr:TetR/AcrR family transcriptional regulator [Paenibacillus alginolyticus]MCY9668703.1 TetR/AcrR family transcriptional regulator [Paenibacillus alginolyticus]